MDVPSFYRPKFVTSKYGEYRSPSRNHEGVDFSHSSTPGTVEVPAMRAGVVVENIYPSDFHGFGNGIIIRSRLDDGDDWDILYGHGYYQPSQRVGDWVKAGEIILHEGTTGWTNGPCVHIEQRRASNGRLTNPEEEALRMGRRWGVPIAPIAPSNARRDTNTRSGIAGVLGAGAPGTFLGVVRGEKVEGNDVWLQGYSGLYFWSGAFNKGDVERLRNA